MSRFAGELAGSTRRDAGAAKWRRIADDRLLKLESPKERELDPLLRRLEPAPEPQVYVASSRRVDFFWRRFRIAIEYLGAAEHEHRGDAVREAELEAMGVRTIVVTKKDLADPDALVAYLLDVAHARAAELGVPPPSLRRKLH